MNDYENARVEYEQAKAALYDARDTMATAASDVAVQVRWMLQRGKIKCEDERALRTLEAFVAGYEGAEQDRKSKAEALDEAWERLSAVEAGNAELSGGPRP